MKHFLLSLLLLAASLGMVAAPQDVRPPLSKDELRDLLTSSTPSKVIISMVQQYGIAFQPTPQTRVELRKAGADTALLDALGQAWHAEIPKPISDKEIRILLAEDVSSENIAAAVLERGIVFHPTDDYLEEIRSEGAKDALIATLRSTVRRPVSKTELLELLTPRIEQDWIVQSVQERGIDFEPSKENLRILQDRGARAPLLEAVRTAKRMKPFVPHFPPPPTVSSPLVQGSASTLVWKSSDTDVPVFADPHDLGNIVAHLRCADTVNFLEKVVSPPGFDRIQYADGKEGFVSSSYLESSIAMPGEGITAPVKVYCPEPPYSPEAGGNKIEGDVKLYIVIDTQGNVSYVREISDPLGGGLDQSAIETVKKWRFTPSKYNGVPVAVRVTVIVSFHLHHDSN